MRILTKSNPELAKDPTKVAAYMQTIFENQAN